jgi:hypothetical protein
LINESVEQYVNEKHAELLKPFLVQRDKGKKKYTEETAKIEVSERLKTAYFK